MWKTKYLKLKRIKKYNLKYFPIYIILKLMQHSLNLNIFNLTIHNIRHYTFHMLESY